MIPVCSSPVSAPRAARDRDEASRRRRSTMPEVYTPRATSKERGRRATRRAAARRGGQDHVGPVRRPGLPRRVFSGTSGPTRTVHVSGHFSAFFGERTSPAHGTRTTTRTSASAPSRHRRQEPRPVPLSSPGICAIVKLTGGKPATRSPARTTRWCGAVGDARTAVAGRGRGARQGRRGQARPACSGWRPRTRRCGSSTTRDAPDRAVVHG